MSQIALRWWPSQLGHARIRNKAGHRDIDIRVSSSGLLGVALMERDD